MKTRNYTLLGIASGVVLSAGSLFAQSTATTAPVGYTTHEIPAGNSLQAPTLLNAIDASGGGVVTSGTVVTVSSASWTPGAFDLHFLEILSGSNVGMTLDVTANDATTVTVNGDLLALGFSANDDIEFSVRKHQTLGSLLPDGGGLAAFSDTVTVYASDGTSATYSYGGTAWVDAFFTNADNTIIYPNTGVVVGAGAAVNVVLTGHVHWKQGDGGATPDMLAQSMIPVYAAAPNIIAASDPRINTTATPSTIPLSNFGFVNSLAAFSENVTTYTTDGTLNPDQTYSHDGTQMVDAFFNNSDNVQVPVGSGVVVGVSADKFITIPAIAP